MGDFALLGAQAFEAVGADTAASRGTLVQADVLANSKGLWTQLIASTARDAHGIMVLIKQAQANRAHLVDIGIGATLAEQVVIPDLLIDQRDQFISEFVFPLEIPSGTRIAARAQSGTGSDNIIVAATLLSQGLEPSSPLGVCSTYGATAADSGGTSIDPGGTAHTKGAWTEVAASTARPHFALGVAFGGQQNGARVSCNWLVDIGIGAGESEQVLIPNIFIESDGRNVAPMSLSPIPIAIPATTRLSARAQCSSIDATDRLFDIVLYGVG